MVLINMDLFHMLSVQEWCIFFGVFIVLLIVCDVHKWFRK